MCARWSCLAGNSDVLLPWRSELCFGFVGWVLRPHTHFAVHSSTGVICCSHSLVVLHPLVLLLPVVVLLPVMVPCFRLTSWAVETVKLLKCGMGVGICGLHYCTTALLVGIGWLVLDQNHMGSFSCTQTHLSSSGGGAPLPPWKRKPTPLLCCEIRVLVLRSSDGSASDLKIYKLT